VVVVVDDDPLVHEVTRAVLADFRFEGRELEFLYAYSAHEAREHFLQRTDIALALIDVVMETESAGLDLVRFVREEAGRNLPRLILRTGQPGLAPEDQIINRYDLHDYWEKTELSARKLVTVVHSALRSYRDLLALETSRLGVQALLEISPGLQACQSLESFAECALQHFLQLMGVPARGARALVGYERQDGIEVLCAPGLDYEKGALVSRLELNLPMLAPARLQQAWSWEAGGFEARLNRRDGRPLFFHIEGVAEPSEEDERLSGLMQHQAEVLLDNLGLWLEALSAQFETIHLLADAVESRSKETGAHTRRVGEIAWILARALGFDAERAEILRRAAPLHDLGKIAVPDQVLNKPGKLDAKEWTIMQSHAQVGYEILAKSPRGPMQVAAMVARDHHEKWDGTGYPAGLKGEEISIEGRIVAVVDVVDALLSRRCYKEPWPLGEVLDLVREQSGRHFDPEVVEAFFHCLPEILQIRKQLPDT
jgi:putative nucleotidyltransferase with HDIG domain